MRYSWQQGGYPIATSLMIKLQNGDAPTLLQALSKFHFTDPDAGVRHAAYARLTTLSPSAGQVLGDALGDGSGDTAQLYEAIDGALGGDPNYLVQQVLVGLDRSAGGELEAWLREATSDTVVLLSELSQNGDYGGLLLSAVQDYGDAAAQTEADLRAVAKTEAGIYGFASWWEGSGAILEGATTGEHLRELLYYDSPAEYIVGYLNNGGELDTLHEAVGRSALFDIRALARAVGVDPDAELPDIAYPAPQPLLYQSVRLASHHLYGSSRLGVNGYWAQQYDALWDYREESKKTDTMRLLARLPWYSWGTSSHVEAYATEVWGHEQALPSLAQHYLGQIQYELTNHLGNVQATVSDKKKAILDGSGRIRLFHSSIAAAYDYYPFGMLMRERTAIDTASRPSYVSRLVSVPVQAGGLVALNGSTTGANYGATLSYGSGAVTMTGVNGELGILVTGLVPGLPVTAQVKISFLGASAQLSARDSADGVQLASIPVSSTGSWDIVFTPTEGQAILKVSVFPYFGTAKPLVTVDRVTWSQQVGVDYRTQLVRVGSRIGDRYEFGFNGQMKANEVAGLGNHNTALFWEYDARLGRRWNLDPKPNPSVSNYASYTNNPIAHTDVYGDSAFNGYTSYRDWAKGKLDQAQAQLDSKVRGEKGYKSALKNYNKALSVYNKYNALYSEVQRNMDNLYVYDREDFDAANNATDPGGKRVDVYIFIEERTAAQMYRDRQAGGPSEQGHTDVQPLRVIGTATSRITGKTTNVYSVTSLAFPGKEGKCAIYLASGCDPETIAHEVGHFVYDVQNLGSYLKWRSEFGNENDFETGHHSPYPDLDTNPGGKAAWEAEKRFKKNYYKR